MDNNRIIELAIEALEARKAQLDKEVEALKVRAAAPAPRIPRAPRARGQKAKAPGSRRPRTAAQKKAQSKRMKAYWAKRKAAMAARSK